jgi:hypothetical protein
VTPEEKELIRQAKNKKPFYPDSFGIKMNRILNRIVLKYYQGKYPFKPSYTSIINFAETDPDDNKIESFLSSKIFQDKYSEFN